MFIRKRQLLFRKNKQQLSLLIHGNNHTRFELTQVQTGRKRRESRGPGVKKDSAPGHYQGLKVARVMAAPHGACNYEMANTLLRAGFEAACISEKRPHGSQSGCSLANFCWPESGRILWVRLTNYSKVQYSMGFNFRNLRGVSGATDHSRWPSRRSRRRTGLARRVGRFD